ncbi:hypothetical protein JCM1841_002960 [Sporobolomyces salmonicolor]
MLRTQLSCTAVRWSARAQPSLKLFHSARSSSSSSHRRVLIGTASTAAVLLGSYALLVQGKVVEMEAEQGKAAGWDRQSQLHEGKQGTLGPEVFLWGRNSHGVTAPPSPSSSSPAPEVIKRPLASPAFSHLVLRDLALSSTYGVALDAKGDVLQWGYGFSAPGAVEKTLVGKDLVRVQPTEEGKVFGLSRRGEIWVWASDKLNQRAGGVEAKLETGSASQGAGGGSSLGWLGKGSLWGTSDANEVECIQLKPDVKLERGEKFVSLSAGSSHLLALTSTGRSFALPLCLRANEYGQLGVRSIELLAPRRPGFSPAGPLTVRLEPDEHINEMARNKVPPVPKNLDPLLLPPTSPLSPSNPAPHEQAIPPLPAPSTGTTPVLHPDPVQHTRLERSIHFCTTLHEIPSLRGVKVVELVAGKNHSLARLGGKAEGRVLGWGAAAYGQLGIGPSLSFPSIPVPTEVPFLRSPAYSNNRPTVAKCVKLAAGGNVSYFVVEVERPGTLGVPVVAVDLLATGQGQFGGIGNGMWAHATSPMRVKSVSGLSEWNETSGRVEPIGIKDVQAGETHVAIVLDNAVTQPSGAKFGRDVLVFGHNEFYQLGTGKRSNLALPQHLPPLPYPGLDKPPTAAAALLDDGEKVEAGVGSSGTPSPMPHKRLQLAPDLRTRQLGRQIRVEEAITAGDGGTAVYWRIVDP